MPRRILLLITDLQIGGTPTVVRELAIRLNRAGLHVEVACLSAAGPVSRQLNELGVTTHALDARGPRDLPRTVARLIRLVRNGGLKPTLQEDGGLKPSPQREGELKAPHKNSPRREPGVGLEGAFSTSKPNPRLPPGAILRGDASTPQEPFDTLFSFLVHANVTAALASLRLRNVRVFQSVQTTQPEPAWHWTAQRFAAHRAEKIIVPSQSVARVTATRSGVSPEKIIVIPNAVDVQQFQPLAPRKPFDPSHIRLGFLGRLDPVKQVDALLHTLPLLHPCYTLHIFGDGIEREKLQRLTLDLNLSPRVTFHGTVATPVDALANIDLLLLPSQAEGFGLVLIEAMAAGIPVIGTNVDGIRDVIQHEQNGVLANSASPTDLLHAIHSLMGDGEQAASRRQRMIDGGLRTVQEKYTWDAVVGAYLDVLQ